MFSPASLRRFEIRCRSLFPLLAGAILLAFSQDAFAQTTAFPGALGFGANATGGRGGSVYHVTTLADSGAGSFRDAVSHSGRIIVFDVGGYINLLTAVSCSGNLTIAGQTAPGGGIGFKGGEISFASRSNIICRYLRIRPGSDTASTGDDALSLYRARNIICDHLSLEFAPWNNIDAVSDDWQNYPVTDITFQNCLIADPTYQQFGAHTESVSSDWTWCYNIFANSHNRNPLSKVNDVFVNNVLYNCSAGYTTHTSTTFDHDLVNNYFIAGPASGGDFPWYQIDNNQSMYFTGNYYDSDKNGTLGGSITAPLPGYQGGGTVLTSPWSSLTATIPTFSAAGAYRYTVSAAGTLPRDQMDNLVLSQIKTLGNGPTGTGAGTAGPDGGLYTSQTQTGLGNNGYGVINGGVAALDTDGDGMPDYWEKAVGLNYLSAGDAMTIAADGYANIEHYLNWLADPHALTITNTAVDVDLWQYTGGFTNVSPVYAVANASNGAVVLNSGHVAHFTPAMNFSGLGSFQFSVTASDGIGYTNTVAVLVTPLTPPSNLVWQGDGTANLWANGSGTNWLNGTNLVTFTSGDTVTFDDTGANAPFINLSGSLTAGTVYVLAEQDYTFGGSGFLAGGTSLFKTGSGRLTLDTANTFAGGTLVNEGTVQVGDGVSFNGGLSGNVTNNDTLIYATPGTLNSPVSISGSGIVTKTGPGILTLSGTQTYTGLTTIAAGALIFSGPPPPSDITNNGSLTFASSGVQIYSNAISGAGFVTASNSGVLFLSGSNTFAGNLTNNSGFLVLSNTSAAGLGTVVYTGGYVVPAGGAVITNNFSMPGSSTSDLSMMATNSGTAIWTGDVVNLGSGASWRPGSDGGTLVFTGTAQQGARNFIVPRGGFQIASNAVVSATGGATAFGRDGSANNRSANVTIRDNAVVTLGACSLGGGKSGGSVTVTVQNSAQLSFGANNLDLHNVTRNTALTTLRLNGGTTTVGGFTKSQANYTNVIYFNGGVLKAGANNAAFLPAFNATTNVVQSGGAVIDDGGFAISIAASLIHDPVLSATADGGLTKLGTGTLTLAAMAESYTGPTMILAGRLTATDAKTLSNTTNIYVAAGAQLDVGGIPFAGTLLGGQKLWGGGVVVGNYRVLGGILAPGSNSIGTLTFSNSLTLASGSSSFFEVSHSPLANDSVVVSGALTNGGTLIVTNIGGAPLAPGDTFQLFSAASYNGSFSSVQLPSLPFGLAWNTNGLNTAGTISVVLTTTPVIRNISISGSALGLSGTGGVGNANFILLGATNLATPLGSWTPLFTNQFDSGGNFNFTNAPGVGGQNFYRLQLQ